MWLRKLVTFPFKLSKGFNCFIRYFESISKIVASESEYYGKCKKSKKTNLKSATKIEVDLILLKR